MTYVLIASTLQERIAVKVRYNRGTTLEFRSTAELVAELQARGLKVRTEPVWDGAPLGNRLIIGEREGRPPP